MKERDVFVAALQIERNAQRREYLRDSCGADDALRCRVEALLEIYGRLGDFLQKPLLVGAADAAQIQGALLKQDCAATLPPPGCPNETHGETEVDEPASPAFLAPPQQPDELGRLGHYRVLRVLGQGGMGVVFLADDTRLQRLVALKVMRPELAANAKNRQRFVREAQAAANVRSEHVITIFAVEQEGDLPYLVMELLHGQSLAEAMSNGTQLPLNLCVRIAREVAQGLAAAHASGLIHRDVKPANIFLGQKEENRSANSGMATAQSACKVKLLDFGLARAVTDSRQLTHQGALLGTPSYMSPEQSSGLPVDSRSDLFSMGTVLYRMVTGREPFERGDLIATLVAVATDPVRPPHEVNSALPSALSELVMRLLAKDPANRPTSAAEVAQMLLALEEGAASDSAAKQKKPSAGEADTVMLPVPSRGPRMRRRRWPALAAGLVAASLVLGIAVAELAGAFRTRSQGDPAPKVAGSAAPEQKDLSPAQALPVEAHALKEFTLSGLSFQIQALAFTADSKTLVSAEYWGGQVKFWDLETRKTTFEMTAVPVGKLLGFAIDPQRRWLAASPLSAVGQVHPGIRVFRFGEPVLLGTLKGHADRVLQMAFLQDGKTMISASFDGSIRRWNLETLTEGKPLRAAGPHLDFLNVWEDGKGGMRLALAGSDRIVSPHTFAGVDDAVLERFSYSPGMAVISPDGTRLACSKQERIVRERESYVSLWELPDKTPLGELAEAPRPQGLAFTADSKRVIVMATDYTTIYEAATGKSVARVNHPNEGSALAVSPDGRWLAVGGVKSGQIRVWNLPSLLPRP